MDPDRHFEADIDVDRYEALLQMADLMVHHRSLPELLPELAQRLHKVASFEFASFSLYDADKNVMRMHLWEGEEALSDLTELPVKESACGFVWEQQQPMVWPDLRQETRFQRRGHGQVQPQPRRFKVGLAEPCTAPIQNHTCPLLRKSPGARVYAAASGDEISAWCRSLVTFAPRSVQSKSTIASVPKPLQSLEAVLEFGIRAAKGPLSIPTNRPLTGMLRIQIEDECDQDSRSGKAVWRLSPRMLAQGSRRQEENSLLIQLDTVRGRGGVEPVASGREVRGRRHSAGKSAPFPVLIQTDAAQPGNPARPEPTGTPTQGMGVSVDPLYLVSCGVLWHQERDASAGWELIQYLRSPDRDARAVAAALLAKTEHARLLVRDLRRARAPVTKPIAHNMGSPEGQAPGKEAAEMNTPYGLEIVDSCLTCKLRKDNWFCSLSQDVLKLLSAESHLSTYPGGAVLFVEGQTPRGAFVLCSGKAKLSTTSREGKVLILKIAEAGEVLGLSAVISGEPFELTAETAGPCQVNFVERKALMRLMEKNGELGMHASQALSREFQSAYRDIHDLVLARSSAGKLARLLLSWTPIREKFEPPEIRVRASLTHEEMAQMIGSSRETVTRLLSDLKKKEFIRLDGTTLVIRNRTALEALAA